MELTLPRRERFGDATISTLFVDGAAECMILEDQVRDVDTDGDGDVDAADVARFKVPGATAIAAGTYRITRTWSPRFKRILPLIHDVPGFTGVRIHPGNDAGDTEGCLLPGQRREGNRVAASKVAFDALDAKLAAALAAGEVVRLTITDEF